MSRFKYWQKQITCLQPQAYQLTQLASNNVHCWSFMKSLSTELQWSEKTLHLSCITLYMKSDYHCYSDNCHILLPQNMGSYAAMLNWQWHMHVFCMFPIHSIAQQINETTEDHTKQDKMKTGPPPALRLPLRNRCISWCRDYWTAPLRQTI